MRLPGRRISTWAGLLLPAAKGQIRANQTDHHFALMGGLPSRNPSILRRTCGVQALGSICCSTLPGSFYSGTYSSEVAGGQRGGARSCVGGLFLLGYDYSRRAIPPVGQNAGERFMECRERLATPRTNGGRQSCLGVR